MVAGLDRHGKYCPHRRIKGGTGLICRTGSFRLLLLRLFCQAVFPELVMLPAWMFRKVMSERVSRVVMHTSGCMEGLLVQRVAEDENYQDLSFNLQRVFHSWC
jgi:hypothetical protein